MRFMQLWSILLMLICGSLAWGQPATRPATLDRKISVAAAADLKFAMDDLVRGFNATPAGAGVKVEVNYGASGTLTAQIMNKAPFDLFLSADRAYPQKLIDGGAARRESLFTYAVGQLVVWTRKESGVDLKPGLAVVGDGKVRTVAIANPKTAPYGRAAEAALKTSGLYEAVKSKLVLAENVAQAAQFAESGNADVGLISRSLAMSPAMAEKGTWTLVPAESYPKLEQGGVITSWAKDEQGAEAFRAFILSEAGKAALRGHGFEVPSSDQGK